MGRKKYYCEFCDRFFNDDRNTRVKHLNSVSHLKLKKEHYDLFRDPETILREESQKKPCRRFHNEGFCPFGSICTYSHYSKYDLDSIQQELWNKNPNYEFNNPPTLESWLAKRTLNPINQSSNKKSMWSHTLPINLAAIAHTLPPSLKPFDIREYLNAELSEWG